MSCLLAVLHSNTFKLDEFNYILVCNRIYYTAECTCNTLMGVLSSYLVIFFFFFTVPSLCSYTDNLLVQQNIIQRCFLPQLNGLL